MSLHIIKLCVGVESIEDLEDWQQQRFKEQGELFHRTRMMPKRRDELLEGGSLYWVIKGQILLRQSLDDLRPLTDTDGIKRCDFILKPGLIPVRPTARRAFQGWRYLKGKDAPRDLAGGGKSYRELPQKMRADLVELCLI